MKHLFNQFIIQILPWMPISIIQFIAGKYVAGESADDALNVVKSLNREGFSATVDILGEHTSDEKTAENITMEYQKLLQSIHEQHLNCNISIKPSHLGMDLNSKCIYENMNRLIDTAKNNKQFIRIDMEDSTSTDPTIELYKKCIEHYDKIGTVLQAYLFRSENDLIKLQNLNGINLRICKGIYHEPVDIAIQNRHDINKNFLKLLKFCFQNNIYVCIATHDITLIKESYNLIDTMNISHDRFEFQVLYGVPMFGWLEKHLKNKYMVRVYVPYGKDWYNYSVRRLKENPNISFYIIRDIFRR